jgi:hypothetical protein
VLTLDELFCPVTDALEEGLLLRLADFERSQEESGQSVCRRSLKVSLHALESSNIPALLSADLLGQCKQTPPPDENIGIRVPE